jgi:hypothetical protein
MACPTRGLQKLLWFQAVTIAVAAGTAFILSRDTSHQQNSLTEGNVFIEVVGQAGRGRVYGFDKPPQMQEVLATGGVEGVRLTGRSVPIKSGSALFVMPDQSVKTGFMSGDHLMDLGLPIPINHADETDLEAIPGIGPSMGARILQDRMKKGPFRNVSDLMRVKGIGPVKAGLLKDYVSF